MTDTENIPQGNCEISVKNPPRKSCMGCLTALIVILALLGIGGSIFKTAKAIKVETGK